jgi:3-methyl-2-oxobutanoate hydroxymethyltransferase
VKRVTISTLQDMKQSGQRITMLTSYDVTFARMVDAAGVDSILVGDSLGMVVQGHDTTLPVTVEDVVYHCRAVARGTRRAHLVGDMPFMSYQVSAEDALRAAGRILAQGGAHAVKLEGGEEVAETVRRLCRAGIPVMGHVGLTPQSVHAMGGFVVQGRSDEGARRILRDALALQEAGAYAVVLEGMPAPLATHVTRQLAIPTIGIGAGPGCDGQVLVVYDLLGLNPDFKAKFVKRYLQGHDVVGAALAQYVKEVREGVFPDESHAFQAKGPPPPVPVKPPERRFLLDVEPDGTPIYGAPV